MRQLTKNATRNPQLSLKITFSLLIRHHLLFIMQGLGRMYLHGLTGRNAYTNGYHQTNEQEADEGTKQQAVDFEGSTVP